MVARTVRLREQYGLAWGAAQRRAYRLAVAAVPKVIALTPPVLRVWPLPGHNVGPQATPFTPYIDARTGITTGTSAFDRARTVQVAIADGTTPNDLIRGKGHVPGLRAREGGVLVRAGHTEGSVDLARLAGLKEAAVICEIVREEDGLMARRDDCVAFARRWGLKVCTIEDLVEYVEEAEGKNGVAA